MKPYRLIVALLPSILSAPTSFAAANIGGCDIFPADNVWNTPINTLPVHTKSSAWINSIGANTGLHMDFGAAKWENQEIGIPYNVVAASKEPKQRFNFLYNDESDPGPYPINSNYRIETGSDHHVLTLDIETCKLYELFNVNFGKTWTADSGAIWDLKSNTLRPIGWTSADAAGLPILPGLVRYEEIEAGVINHAIRFTMQSTNSYIWPGSHLTSGKAGVLTNTPPMGARFRLKADYDISGFDPKVQVILKAMKTYGIINADNGANWFVSGVPDPRWNDELLATLSKVKGNAFEAVDESCLMVNENSAQANLSKCATPAKDIKNQPAAPAPQIAGCEVFPGNNFWNTPIDQLPVHPYSDNWLNNMGKGTELHMDFGAEKWEGKEIGIPYNTVDASKERKYSFNFLYNDESDAGPYPIGVNSKVEEGSDHHLLVLDKESCKLYEIFNATNTDGAWNGDSGAVWDLKSNNFRPLGWTSADAAGLAILPGLVRYDEIASGAINHALRFTVEKTRGYLWPGTHLTMDVVGDVKYVKERPPLGARFRLKPTFDISGYDKSLQVILKAMKTYGIILADNGGDWFISGEPSSKWNDELLAVLREIRGADFEAVDTSCMVVSPDSGEANLSKCGIIPSKQPTTSACTYTLDFNTKNFKATGGIDSVSVKISNDNGSCKWTAKSNESWLPIYAQSSGKTQRVVYAVARNKTGKTRTGTVNIAGQTLTITQAAK